MTLIRLAANPFSQEAPEMTQTIAKGRRVSGPRTKLAAQPVTKADLALIRREQAETQRAVLSLARSVQTLAKGLIDNEDDMMAAPPVQDEEQDMVEHQGLPEEQPLDLAEDFDSDFDPYGDEEVEDPEGYNTDDEDATENELGIHDGDLTKAIAKAVTTALNRARVRKDDAASSFGEKDDDIPGNRRYIPDDKSRPAEEYLIQGSEEDGPSVNKAMPVTNAVIRKAVTDTLRSMGIVRRSVTSGVPASTVQKADEQQADEWTLFEQAKGKSFAEINRFRTEIGDLPAGIL